MKANKTCAREAVLSTQKPAQAIVRMAVPATLALLAKAVYNIVDTAYIGMLDSDVALFNGCLRKAVKLSNLCKCNEIS